MSMMGTVDSAYLAGMLLRHIQAKEEAFQYAKSLVIYKGIVNLGSSGSNAIGYGTEYIATDDDTVLNVDISDIGHPRFFQWDLEKSLPFLNKSFDVAFASHILEHLTGWESSLRDWIRISSRVVLVLPNPNWVVNILRLNRQHKHYFSFEDMRRIASAYSSVTIFT